MQFIRQLHQSEGLQQAVFTVVGNIIASGVAAISLILISRTLGPAEFGVFSVGLSIATILAKINTAGLNTALTKCAASEQDTEKKNALFSLTLWYKARIAFLLVLLSLCILPIFITVFNTTRNDIVIAAIIFFTITVAYEHAILVLQTLHLFNKAVLLTLVQAIIKCIGVLVLLLLKISETLTYFILYVSAPLVAVLVAYKLLPKEYPITLDTGITKTDKKQFLRLVKYSATAVVIAALVENIDILFINYYFSDYETGLLSGVSKIAMIVSVVAYSLGNVLYARVARYRSKRHLRKYLQKASIVSLCCLASFSLFVPIAPNLMYLTVGPAYTEALGVLLILLLSAFITLATVPFSAVFFALKADWVFLMNAVVILIVIMGGNMLFVKTGGLEAAALVRLAATFLAYLSTVVLAVWEYHKEFGKSRH